MTAPLFPWRAVARPRFEPFLAIWSYLSTRATRHRDWARKVRSALSPETKRALHALNNCALAWPIIADLPGPANLDCTIEDLADAIGRMDGESFARDFLAHAIHDNSLAQRVADRSIDIQGALALLPGAKREWLSHIGLFPFDRASDIVRLIDSLIQDPKAAQQAAMAAVKGFWRDIFRETWNDLSTAMEISRAGAQEILSEGDWERLGHRLGLNVEVDLSRHELRALRGGYRLPFTEIAEAIFMPSAFNEEHFWTVHETARGGLAYFPYFDPSLTVTGDRPAKRGKPESAPSRPTPDVALAFRALGDATRFAIASLIAKRPMSATEIGRQLGLSKPSITHHLHELRQAGLIDESARGAALSLSLSRAAIAQLGDLALHSLFDSLDSGKIARTRRTS